MKNRSFKLTKLACYTSNFTMSSIFCVPPLLFVTFRETYGISYTLLGTLVLANFCTQLAIDLIFTFFSKYLDVKRIAWLMPLITSSGLLIYGLIPTFFPSYAYAGLLAGTVVFSVAAGLSEVLVSPIIAAIPSDNPQRDMSFLHSLYAFGVFTMVSISTVFFRFFDSDKWMWLIMIFAALPVASSVMYMLSPMPEMNSEGVTASHGSNSKKRTVGLVLCTACIFFGSCAENAMSSWISTYMEKALGINKAVGDILGVAMFAVLLGIARILYSRFGKNICRVLLFSMIGASVCYIVAGLSPSVVVSFVACIMTGFCTSMLWPGTLIMMEEKIPHAGVAAFALMAAGGDLGASVSPQLMGIVVDKVSASQFFAELGNTFNIPAEKVGLNVGMLVSALFPIIGTVIVLAIMRYFKKKA